MVLIGAGLLVDTHAHLTEALFDADREGVMERASAAGVERILCVSLDEESSRKTLKLAADYETVEAAVGIHPSESDGFASDGEAIREFITSAQIRAVGEIGLDYGRCPVPRETQMRAFRAQVRWAVEATLPVVVHDRDAHDNVLEVLGEFGAVGVLHCFSGDADLVCRAVSMNLFVSFAGNVTYKNADNLHLAARSVQLDRLLLETDSPYLPPQPWRGERNEPAHVTAVAEKVSELRGCSVEELARATTANAAALFGWKVEGG